MGRKGPRTTKELFNIATSHALDEEAVGAIFDRLKGKARWDEDTGKGTTNRPAKKKNKQWHEGSLVAAADCRGGRKPCPNHAFPVKHLYKDCGLMKQFLSGGSNKGEHRKDLDLTTDDAKGMDGGFPTPDGCLMIFRGSAAYDSKRRQKVAHREVYMTEPAMPTFLRWSESAITFDWTDHPGAGEVPAHD